MKVRKLLFLTGQELSSDSDKRIKDFVKNDYCILAVDSDVLFFAQKNGFPVCLIDDFVSTEELLLIAEKAFVIEKLWFSNNFDGFIINGINLPALDHHALFWFWRDVLLSEFLLIKCFDAGYQEIQVLQKHKQVPYIYYSRDMIWKETFVNPCYKRHILKKRNVIRVLNNNKITRQYIPLDRKVF